MKILKDITEDEFIATFLKGELTSTRFGNKIIKQLGRDGKNKSIIETPNILDIQENSYRKNLLGILRGYGINKKLFEGFPNNVSWKRVQIDIDDLKRSKYIDYDYWVNLTNGSRSPVDAAENIKKGIEIFDVSNIKFLEASKYLKDGGSFSNLIFVCKNLEDDLVILEGHLRITAYFLEPITIPENIDCIIGISENFEHWGLY